MSTNEQIAHLEMVIFRQENKPPATPPAPCVLGSGATHSNRKFASVRLSRDDDFLDDAQHHQQKDAADVQAHWKWEKWLVRTLMGEHVIK